MQMEFVWMVTCAGSINSAMTCHLLIVVFSAFARAQLACASMSIHVYDIVIQPSCGILCSKLQPAPRNLYYSSTFTLPDSFMYVESFISYYIYDIARTTKIAFFNQGNMWYKDSHSYSLEIHLHVLSIPGFHLGVMGSILTWELSSTWEWKSPRQL